MWTVKYEIWLVKMLVNELTWSDWFSSLTEVLLQEKNVSLNESTSPSHLDSHNPHGSDGGEGVAAIYHESTLLGSIVFRPVGCFCLSFCLSS